MGMRPHPSRPTKPLRRARLRTARTLSFPWVCWVIPIPQTKTARSARPTISAKARMASRETPEASSKASKGRASRRAW